MSWNLIDRLLMNGMGWLATVSSGSTTQLVEFWMAKEWHLGHLGPHTRQFQPHVCGVQEVLACRRTVNNEACIIRILQEIDQVVGCENVAKISVLLEGVNECVGDGVKYHHSGSEHSQSKSCL